MRFVDALVWVLFKLLQTAVAGVFTAVVVLQTSLAGLIRKFGEPSALVKVQHARTLWASGGDPVAVATANSTPQSKPPAELRRRASAILTVSDGSNGAAAAATCPRPQEPKAVHVFPEPDQGHDSEAWKQIGPYMRKYGRHAIANSQLFNPEYIHFFVPGIGSLPYILMDLYNRAAIFGIGEPLADRAAWRQLTELFLAEFPGAYFYHVTEEYADLLHDMGYYINCCGTETTLQVQSWTYNGKTRTVRAAARAARDAGLRVRELKPEELTDEMRHRLQHDVSGDWHQQKAIADRELRVFVRNVDYEAMELREGIRIFVAEAYDPAVAPPAFVDRVLQGAALNAKPPKPPRVKRSASAASNLSFKQLRHSSSQQLSTAGSSCSLISLPSISTGSLTERSHSFSRIPSDTAADGAAAGGDCEASAAASTLEHPAGLDSSRCDNKSDTSSPKSDSSSCLVSIVATSTSLEAVAAAAPREAFYKPAALPDGTAAAAGVPDVAGAAAGGAGVAEQTAQRPQLVGFVLLDPLWEDNEEVGYVASLMRMKRTAHSGTLKLLCEDIISTLRREGRKEFTFGFAPLFNLRDSNQQRRYIHWLNWLKCYIFYFANNVYAFKNLAFAKVRYGAGLDAQGKQFRDPNVTLTYVYMAAKDYTPGFNLLDLYGLLTYVGLIDTPLGVFAKLVGLTRGGANLDK